MVTLKEIAERCHVSATTVSNVINGKAKTSKETERRILSVIEETGYKPNEVAKGLRMKRTRTIAIIAEDIAQFTVPPIIEGIMEYCERENYRVSVRNLRLYARWADTWYDQEIAYHSVLDPVLRDLQSARVEGIIYIAGHARVIHCCSDDYPIPVVMAYAFSDSPALPSVVIDDEMSAFEEVSYLLKMGHKRIGVIGGRVENNHTQQRLLGYQRALFEEGILFDPNLVYYGDWTRESGYNGAKELYEHGVTAFFGISDKMSGGIYDFLEEKGLRVGRDISVIGFDDESIAAYYRPALTTTALPLSQIGHTSAGLLIDRLEKRLEDIPEDRPQVIKIPCTMVYRDSVALAAG